MIYKATLTLCLVVVGLAGTLATEERRSSRFIKRSEREDNDNVLTVGICDQISDNFYLSGTKTFSVFNNKADLSLPNISAPYYNDDQFCYLHIVGVDGLPRLKVEVIINSEINYDYLELYSGEYYDKFTGYNFYKTKKVLPTNAITVLWITDTSRYFELGFSLKVTGTYEEAGDYPDSNDHVKTVGVCYQNFQNFYLSGAKTFSVFNNKADLSLPNSNAPYYDSNARCKLHIVDIDGYPRFKVEITINSYRYSDYLLLASGEYSSRFSGPHFYKKTTVLPTNELTIQWITDFWIEYTLGFSLKVTGTYEEAGDYPDTNDNTITTGICDHHLENCNFTGTKVFSVYKNDADLSLDNTTAPYYGDHQHCILNVINIDGYPRLKVEVRLNSDSGLDVLNLYSGSYRGQFSGYDRETLVLPSNGVSVEWFTDQDVNYELGFSLKVFGTYDESTVQ